jgi:hypothetical protein
LEIPVLTESVRKQLGQAFAEMQETARLVLFTQGNNRGLACDMFANTRGLQEKLAEVCGRSTPRCVTCSRLREGGAMPDRENAGDCSPVAMEIPLQSTGFVFSASPAGYDLGFLIYGILMVSRGGHGLVPDVLEHIWKHVRAFQIQVFSTPT